MPQSKTSSLLEPKTEFDHWVMGQLSREGMKINSSTDLGDGQWAHEAEFAPGTLMYTRLPAETDKDK